MRASLRMQNNKITCEKKKVKARIKHKKGLAESKQGKNEKATAHRTRRRGKY